MEGEHPGPHPAAHPCPEPFVASLTLPSASLQDWAAQRCTISYRAPELFTVPSQCVIDERTDIWVRIWPPPPLHTMWGGVALTPPCSSP